MKLLKNLNMDKLLVEGAEAGFRGPSSDQGLTAVVLEVVFP